MDKQTLKSTIIELKNNRTFQEVSDILKSEYGINMSRQAVHGMYNRAISNKQIEKNINLLLATSDIVNYKCLGYDNKQIKKILDNQSRDISLNCINEIVEKEIEHCLKVNSDMLNKVVEDIKKNKDLDYIINRLAYKGVRPTKEVGERLIEEAASEILKSRALDLMVKLINITDSRDLAKKVSNKHNFNITCKEISEALNK